MFWWGKIAGVIFGFLLARFVGAIIGFFIGHSFDKAFAAQHDVRSIFFGGGRAKTSEAFFLATFTLMGHVAKATGRVSEDEIQVARRIMQRLGVHGQRRTQAIQFFNQGKQPDYDLNQAILTLKQACRANRALLQLFMEIQLEAAYAEGFLDARKRTILMQVGQALGFSPLLFTRLDEMYQAEQRFEHRSQQHSQQGHQRYAHAQTKASRQDAYQLLGIQQDATPAEIKRAYRKLMSQHHPDKLVAKGLPEDMIKVATRKTQEIKAAYDEIKQARGIS